METIVEQARVRNRYELVATKGDKEHTLLLYADSQHEALELALKTGFTPTVKSEGPTLLHLSLVGHYDYELNCVVNDPHEATVEGDVFARPKGSKP